MEVVSRRYLQNYKWKENSTKNEVRGKLKDHALGVIVRYIRVKIFGVHGTINDYVAVCILTPGDTCSPFHLLNSFDANGMYIMLRSPYLLLAGETL